MKLRLLEADLFHADGGQTDMMKLIFDLRNFARAPKHLFLPHSKHSEVSITEFNHSAC